MAKQVTTSQLSWFIQNLFWSSAKAFVAFRHNFKFVESFAFSCFVHVAAGLSYETAGILIIYVIDVKLLE